MSRGSQVFRDNLYYDRTVRYDDYATSTSSDNEEANIEIEADLLQAGVNVLAVEVHNRDPTSSDVSFDFALIPAPHSIGLLNEGAGWRYFDSVGSTVGVPDLDAFFPSVSRVRCAGCGVSLTLFPTCFLTNITLLGLLNLNCGDRRLTD